MKIRPGDTVVITTGKDKGKTGQVLRTLASKGRVVVADANMRTRHIKGGPNRAGEIVKYEASIAVSNVMLVDPKTKKRSRIGFKKDAKGHKVRIAKNSGEEVKKSAVATKKKVAASTEETKAAKTAKDDTTKVQDPKSPFWKKMGFGAEEMSNAGDIDVKNDDHSVPDQVERSSSRSSQRGA